MSPKLTPLDELPRLDPEEVGISQHDPIQWKPWAFMREKLRALFFRSEKR